MPIRSTSFAAHSSVRKYKTVQSDKILAFIQSCKRHGATLEEIATQTGIKLQSCCGARLALEKERLITDSGHRRATTSGRNAIVWVSSL